METPGPVPIRTRSLPRKTLTLFACSKCRKKLKRSGAAPLKLNKLFKHAARNTGSTRVRLVDLPCLKLCPRRAVTACTASQLARSECSILRTPSDAQALYTLATAEATTPHIQHPLLLD